MTKKRAEGSEGGAGALTHNPFAALASKRDLVTTSHESPATRHHQSPAKPAVREPAAPRARPVRLRLESKGRSGKIVTRITGLPSPNLQAIASRLRKALGCGAVVEGEDLLLLGSLAERASQWLDAVGDLRQIQEEPAKRQVERPTPQASELVAPAVGGSGTKRSDVRPGLRVGIVLKADQSTGKLTEGIVRDILTSSPTHPRGIKVRLETGDVGRVKIVYP